ncbi:hypothetical protein K5X82_04285 [Halosquirtibacter xylanolyticus]|uniref:hypothetical protein n=1 Tax=Halosquirtibacter xylanolyticus TaxID=3374599 RepID=UPI003749DC70|nr:hypothetical protein K5X82_04285 [Prolixibacteraceae bacterium]
MEFEPTISSWVKKNKANGLSGLQSKKNGVKSEDLKLLTLEQEKLIQSLILDKMPDQLKLNFALWTREAV